MHLRSRSCLYIKDSIDNTVRSTIFDLNGEFVETGNIAGHALVNAEIRSSGDFNDDNLTGAELGSLLYGPTTVSGGNPQRYVYESDRGWIIFRDQPAPMGGENQPTIQGGSFNINGYDGPSIVVADSSLSLNNTERITAARVTRSPITADS